MTESYQKLLRNNQEWAAEKYAADGDYFNNLAKGQSPEYLWIGCSDSRVSANEVTQTQPGEIFVHRNIANVVIQTDMNLLSVLYFAVDILRVKHVIICGHYGCGGVNAAMQNRDFGFVNNWLRSIKEVYVKHKKELEAIKDLKSRERRLVELNIIEQTNNLAKTRIVQRAWKKGSLQIHSWVFDCKIGLIKELNNKVSSLQDVEPIFRYEL
ncbi:MAG: carbonic anhydrase [Sphingobacteriales bacterium]|jgi:carbonic anhydrase|nr:carbonic anhydrase [Sphingobacteriales bacterium]MBP9142145.1 carbonic anhydrase [Chitinophagales bacterium]MDA0199384.1 carbonic anhydrase [Bacteroidota bacterium]MBK6891025.1 carbonic anhydrase [Sphingobacteriales bacterium]MBK7527145.1 carbonic anhydrase [Sphingobacteriales bacterium]